MLLVACRCHRKHDGKRREELRKREGREREREREEKEKRRRDRQKDGKREGKGQNLFNNKKGSLPWGGASARHQGRPWGSMAMTCSL